MKESVLLHVVEDGRPPVNIITNAESIEHAMYAIHYIDERLILTAWLGDVRATSHRLYDSVDSYMRDRFNTVIEMVEVDEADEYEDRD